MSLLCAPPSDFQRRASQLLMVKAAWKEAPRQIVLLLQAQKRYGFCNTLSTHLPLACPSPLWPGQLHQDAAQLGAALPAASCWVSLLQETSFLSAPALPQ